MCSTEFRLDAPGKPLEKLPIREQDKMGNCYAHAAATLIDAWGLSHAPPSGYVDQNHRSLPQWLSAPEDQHVHYGLNFAKENGSCNETAFLKRKQGLAAGHEKYQTQFNEITSKILKLRETLNQSDEKFEAAANEIACRLKREVLPPGVKVTFSDIESALTAAVITGGLYPEIKKFFEEACKDNLEKPLLPQAQLHNFNMAPAPLEVTTRIDAMLRRNQDKLQPLAITYCNKILSEGKRFSGITGYSLEERAYNFNNSPGCGGHASVLLGRRWNQKKGHCEFLIRNSWGSHCEGIKRSEIDCDPNTGQFWLDSLDMSKSVLDLNSL